MINFFFSLTQIKNFTRYTLNNSIRRLFSTPYYIFTNQTNKQNIGFQKVKSLRAKKPKEQLQFSNNDNNEERNQSLNQQINNNFIINDDIKQKLNINVQNTPPNIIVKNLIWPPTKSHIILLGVEKRNALHASYISDIINSLKPDVVTTQIQPDLPYFIKTQIDFNLAWKKFIKGRFDYKFFISTNPKYLIDILLSNENIHTLLSGPFLNSKNDFELGSIFLYTYHHINKKLEIDSFFTPLVYSYNNSDKNLPIIINDYPFLKQRDNIVRTMNLLDLQQLFKQYVEEQKKKNSNFDPCLLKPEFFITPKIGYICETLKQTCNQYKKIISVVDRHCADMIEETWKSSTNKKMTSLQDFLQISKTTQQLTFVDYIEKHVILDLMLEPLLQNYFVQYQSFPFLPKDTLGYWSMLQNIFIIYEHYYKQYSKNLFDKIPDIKEKFLDNAGKVESSQYSIFN